MLEGVNMNYPENLLIRTNAAQINLLNFFTFYLIKWSAKIFK